MVPEGWEVKHLSDLTSKISDGIHSTPVYTEKSGIYFINGNNLKNGSIVIQESTKCVNENDAVNHQKDLSDRTLLMSINGTIGNLAYYRGENVVLGKSACYINVRNNTDIDFIYYVLSDAKTQALYESELTGTTIRNLSLKSIKSTKIKTPLLPEQKKIAQILSTWDKAITTTEQLLANSQQQKKALMQQLLTGKKRLLDKNGDRFNDEWKEFSLEKIFTFKKGKGLSKSVICESGKNKCVLYGELYTRYPEVIDTVYSRTDSDDGTPSIDGDILIPSSTTTSGIDLANATAILEDGVLLGGDINILRPKRTLSPSFIAHLLTHIKKHEIASRAQGITIIHLYGSDLKSIKVKIPDDVAEQQKIARVLSNADDKINVLQQKFDAFKQEKKALMQQLLAGKRRVKL